MFGPHQSASSTEQSLSSVDGNDILFVELTEMVSSFEKRQEGHVASSTCLIALFSVCCLTHFLKCHHSGNCPRIGSLRHQVFSVSRLSRYKSTVVASKSLGNVLGIRPCVCCAICFRFSQILSSSSHERNFSSTHFLYAQ